jgi:formiminoglutamase
LEPFELRHGTSPVILAFPHVGTYVPETIADRLNAEGRLLRDTDWHVDRLYDGLLPEASVLRATFHRYVIDANRDPSGASLYPGQNTTGLVPVTDFDGAPIWRDGAEPTEDDIARRLIGFHAPYHRALADEIQRVRAMHGVAVVYDCHSIRSQVPFLFAGTLPDFNIGTDGGRTCAPAVEAAVAETCRAATGYSSALNGRFRGGWTTRHYGDPTRNVHAVQMEISQATYLASETPPFEFDPDRAERLRPVLGAALGRLSSVALSLKDAKAR